MSSKGKINEELLRRGLSSIDDLLDLKKNPMSVIHQNPAINSIKSYQEWLKVQHEEALSFQLNLFLDGKTSGEYAEDYGWALAKVSVFMEARINLDRALSAQ